MDQIHLMCNDFGSRLDHRSDEMCQMNTRIGRISPTIPSWWFCSFSMPDPFAESFDNGDDDSDDASSSAHDNEMTFS